MSAPEYVDHLMTWTQNHLEDESLFPTALGVPFPKNFMSTIKQIFKRLFRVYAHIYYSHLEEIEKLGQGVYVHTSFKHFVYFVTKFELLESKEWLPLQELVQGILDQPDHPAGA